MLSRDPFVKSLVIKVDGPRVSLLGLADKGLVDSCRSLGIILSPLVFNEVPVNFPVPSPNCRWVNAELLGKLNI